MITRILPTIALCLISFNALSANFGYTSSKTVAPALGYHHRLPQPIWVTTSNRQSLPANAVIGGNLLNNDAVYICRANVRGELHVGKLISGSCYIGWNTQEISVKKFEILTSAAPIVWMEGSYGTKPIHALPAGRNHNHTLYICQADYANSSHPGQLIGKNCHFSFNGKEYMTPYYNMLVVSNA